MRRLLLLLKGPVDRRLWLATVVAILVIAGGGIAIARSIPSHTPSPIGLRLLAAVVVTVVVAAARLAIGPRAAALAGVLGVLVAVVLLITIA